MNAIKLPNRNRIVRYSELENLISTDSVSYTHLDQESWTMAFMQRGGDPL